MGSTSSTQLGREVLGARFQFTSCSREDAIPGGLPIGPRLGFVRKPYDIETPAATIRVILESPAVAEAESS